MVNLRCRRPHRVGFTLIELLVVITLIGVLAALSAGAFMRVRASQIKAASEATLVKLNTALDNRWKAIQESVNEDQKKNQGQWPNALLAAGGNPDVAKSLLMYAKVKNELPMTFAEAKAPTILTVNPGSGPVSIILASKQVFSTLPISAANFQEQSAICFYLAVTTSAGGGAMLDSDGLNQQTADAPNFPGFKVYKDAWDMPIAFVRHAYATELDDKPFVRNIAAANKDPFDPAGKLPAVMAVNPMLWKQITNNAPTGYTIPSPYVSNRNHVPTLVSAGPNKSYEPDLFAGTDNDNLLSYRLRREGNRGD